MKKTIVFMFGLLLLNSFVFSYYTSEDDYAPRTYDNAKVIRVKYITGETYVKRSYDEGFEEAAVNLPVFENDIIGTTAGRLELYLGRLNYLRLDYDSEVIFERAPELRKTRTTIRVNHGGIYLFVNNLDYVRDIEIQTPDCGIFIQQRGKYRINVNARTGSEVFVYRGLAEVSGEYESMNIGAQYKVTMFDGQVAQRPFSMISSLDDDFDFWNAERNRLLGIHQGYRSRYLDPAYADYEYELSAAGTWRYDRSYNTHIWIPYNLGTFWRPYYHGRWVYHPYYGYVWTSYDPWGWYTHHYGRWHWSPAYGWYWLPGKRWSPAWVFWSWTDNHYGWCPLSRWNRPVIVINKRWVRDYNYRSGLPFHSSSIIIVKRVNLWAPRIHKIVLTESSLVKLKHSKLRFKGRHPELRPVVSHISVINAKGKTVKYKKSGFLSTEKYKVVKAKTGTKVNVEKVSIYRYQGGKGEQASARMVNRYSQSPEKIRLKRRTTSKPEGRVYKSLSRKKPSVLKRNVTDKPPKGSPTKKPEITPIKTNIKKTSTKKSAEVERTGTPVKKGISSNTQVTKKRTRVVQTQKPMKKNTTGKTTIYSKTTTVKVTKPTRSTEVSRTTVRRTKSTGSKVIKSTTSKSTVKKTYTIEKKSTGKSTKISKKKSAKKSSATKSKKKKKKK